THFKTVRAGGSKADNFYKRWPGLLQLVSEPVPGWWWGKPNGGQTSARTLSPKGGWYQSRCRAGGGANLSEDAESQGG
ncbi:hypothetical protein HAX54_035363, partial [Datura stramonium]|nr:hypothetical protein [Datura stramonium]